MRRRATTWAALLLLSFGPGAAQAYVETFDPGRPQEALLGGVLDFGPAGAWEGRLEDGAYVLENRSEPAAVRYYWLGSVPDEPQLVPAEAPVSVTVEGEFGGELAGAGLVYRLEPETRHYYAFVVLGGGRYALFERGADGFQPRLSGTSPAIRPDGANRLAIEPDGETMRLSINGETVGSLGSRAILGHGAGIVALGQGTFRFDEFRIGEAARAAVPGWASSDG